MYNASIKKKKLKYMKIILINMYFLFLNCLKKILEKMKEDKALVSQEANYLWKN